MKAARHATLVTALAALGACEAIFGIGDTELDGGDGRGGTGADNGASGGSTNAGDGGASSGIGGNDGGEAGRDQGGMATGGRSGRGGSGGVDDGGDSGIGGDGEMGGAGGKGGTGGKGGMVGTGGVVGTGGGTGAGGATGNAGNAGSGGGSEPPTEERIFRSNRTWPNPLLNVCFSVPEYVGPAVADEIRSFAAKVRDLVESTWGRHANIPFLDWEECGNAGQFKLTLTAYEPSSAGLGYPAGGPRVITLNKDASDAEILYLWGRALGFEHEYGRAAWTGQCIACDSNDDCTTDGRTSCLSSGYCGNARDQESIMAAPDCAGIQATRRITPWDILGAQRAYGRKHAGAVTDHRGRCLRGNGPERGPGTGLYLYPCLEARADEWERSFATASGESDWLRMQTPDRNLCAQVSGPSASAQVLQGACSRTASSQHVELRSVELRVVGTQCVVVDTAEPGALLRSRHCSGSSFRRWSIRDGRIELAGSGLCVAVRGGVAVYNTPLELASCDSGNLAQRFQFPPGEIWYFDSRGDSACFAQYGGQPNTSSEGFDIKLWDGCGQNVENLVFYTRGPLEIDGRCFDLLDGQSHTGSLVSVSTCDGSSRQQWDYHW